MGTNYYAKLNIEKSIVDALYVSPIARLCLENFNIHIGKLSGGYKFLFQEQKVYDCISHSGNLIKLNSYQRWKRFLEEEGIAIYDEYNKVIDKACFFSLVQHRQDDKYIRPKCHYVDSSAYCFMEGDFD